MIAKEPINEVQKQYAVAEFGNLIGRTLDNVYLDNDKREEYLLLMEKNEVGIFDVA